MIEVNCETDFVAKNAEFIELTNGLAQMVAETNPADVEALLASVCPKCNKPTKIGYEMDKDQKVRVCKKCGAKLK